MKSMQEMEKLFDDFVAYAREVKLPLEAIAIADEKQVLKEHHFVPDLARNIYSHTKSYMSTAVGLAVSKGILSVEDKLADFFPEDCLQDAPDMLFEIRLKHLLTMSSGFGEPYLMGADRRAGKGMPDYMRYMLSRPVQKTPGSEFLYSTADSYLAGRMAEKVTGKRLSQFLYEEIFAPLGVSYPIWENDPQGHPIGGGGMFLKLTDMMKLGQLYLADGVWNGKRLVDSAWIKEATKKQIETDPVPEAVEDYWRCGYGYQFWLSPYPDSYRADGAYGQVTTVLPKSGLVVAVQSPEVGDFGKVKDALHQMLLSQL